MKQSLTRCEFYHKFILL